MYKEYTTKNYHFEWVRGGEFIEVFDKLKPLNSHIGSIYTWDEEKNRPTICENQFETTCLEWVEENEG